MKQSPESLELASQQVSRDVLLEKYAKGGETSIEDIRQRVATVLASVESDPDYWRERFYEALATGFIPAGRINSAAGTDLCATLINCFVQPGFDYRDRQWQAGYLHGTGRGRRNHAPWWWRRL